MKTCLWCGTSNHEENSNCVSCGAPMGTNVNVVFIDLTSLEGKIALTIKKLPAMVKDILPGASFSLSFDGTTATILPKKASTAHNSGAIAQGKNAVAVGQGGIYVGGDVTGSNFVIGNNNNVSSTVKKQEEKKLALWLPANVQYLIVSGNGQTRVINQYPDSQLETTDTID